jgi:hypothetical protein
MLILKIAIAAFVAMLASPAGALTMEQAFVQCRARYAHMPEMPGSGDPVKAATIESCARQLMSRQSQPQPTKKQQERRN